MKKNNIENLHEIVALFLKSLFDTLTDNERAELDKSLADDEVRDVYRRINDKEFIIAKLREHDSYPYRPAYEKFLKKGVRRIFLRSMIAAVSVAVIAALSIFVNYRQAQREEMPVVINSGRNLAMLTLSDGSSVTIDGNTVLPEKLAGMARISENGALVYDVDNTRLRTGYNQIYIPIAGEYKLGLGDNTTVWLNADSRLRYPVCFPENERRVMLQGEAYFEVIPDERPFIVQTATGEIRVLGTSFGVSVYPGETGYTTLVKGSVSFSCEAGEVFLEPGEQAVLTVGGELSKRMVDVEEYVGWKSGELIFRDKPLEDIMCILNRWYGIKTEFTEPSLASLRYTGNLMRYESINTFLEILVRLNDINYRIYDDKVLIYK